MTSKKKAKACNTHAHAFYFVTIDHQNSDRELDTFTIATLSQLHLPSHTASCLAIAKDISYFSLIEHLTSSETKN